MEPWCNLALIKRSHVLQWCIHIQCQMLKLHLLFQITPNPVGNTLKGPLDTSQRKWTGTRCHPFLSLTHRILSSPYVFRRQSARNLIISQVPMLPCLFKNFSNPTIIRFTGILFLILPNLRRFEIRMEPACVVTICCCLSGSSIISHVGMNLQGKFYLLASLFARTSSPFSAATHNIKEITFISFFRRM